MDGIRATSSYSPRNAAGECKADGMVKIELEAAEALAGLAHFAVTENHGGDSALSEPVKDEELPPGHSEFDPVDSVREPPNLAEDQGLLQQQHCEKVQNILIKPIKDEEFFEADLNPTCTTSYASSASGKSRQNLTEAEKEARRIRRVLANRESARQTIRRRQAIFEELTRKAADLAWENEKLKKEMESAVEEYDSLKSINESLKTQMTKMLKVEAEETQEETHAEIAACPSTKSPFLICNQPAFFPFVWPSMVQPTNSVQLQCGPQGGIVFPSPIPMPANPKLDPSSYGEGNPIIANGSGSPLYVLPCPWLFPLPQHSFEHQLQSFDLNDKPHETPHSNQYSPCSSAETVVHMENYHLLPIKVKAEASMSEEAILANCLHDNSLGHSPDGVGQHIGSRPRGNVLMPIPLRCVRPDISVEHEKSSQLENTREVKTHSTAASDMASSLLEKSQEPVTGKRMEDVTAAAKARKRRKELTKLKSLNCRQFRMHYV